MPSATLNFSDWILHAEALDARLGNAVRAADIGGRILLEYWRTLRESAIHEKSKGDLVTTADLESEQAVTKFLRAKYPDAAIVSEEGTAHAGTDTIWYIDPLDGTTNFVHQFPVFAVSIGCVRAHEHGHELLCGAVWNPVAHELFYAAKGRGSFRNGTRIQCSAKLQLSDCMLATGFPRRYQDELPAYLREFAAIFPRCRAIRRAGSAALDLCWTAQGVFDGFWEHRLAPWDLAAGALIVEEAGGVCSDFSGGRNFLLSGNIVGAAQGIHGSLLDIVRAARES
jgi:myo-inositol-1(or 4)-monophosphatase